MRLLFLFPILLVMQCCILPFDNTKQKWEKDHCIWLKTHQKEIKNNKYK